jgi:hypothetical protein
MNVTVSATWIDISQLRVLVVGSGGGIAEGFGQSFAKESRRHRGGENGAIPVLANFKCLKKHFHIGIGALRWDCIFGGVKQAQERAQLAGQMLRIGGT